METPRAGGQDLTSSRLHHRGREQRRGVHRERDHTHGQHLDAAPGGAGRGGGIGSAASLDGTQAWVAGAATTTTGGLCTWPGARAGREDKHDHGARRADSSEDSSDADLNANPRGLFMRNSRRADDPPAPTLAELPGLPTSGGSPFGFVFLTVNGVQTLYIVGTIRGGGVGGILKFTLSGATWSSAGHVQGMAGPDGERDCRLPQSGGLRHGNHRHAHGLDRDGGGRTGRARCPRRHLEPAPRARRWSPPPLPTSAASRAPHPEPMPPSAAGVIQCGFFVDDAPVSHSPLAGRVVGEHRRTGR